MDRGPPAHPAVELAASVGHIANWYQIGHGGYVSSFTAPSPVRHFWSLAVEEQFYVLWPMLLVGLLAMVSGAAGGPTRRR